MIAIQFNRYNHIDHPSLNIGKLFFKKPNITTGYDDKHSVDQIPGQ